MLANPCNHHMPRKFLLLVFPHTHNALHHRQQHLFTSDNALEDMGIQGITATRMIKVSRKFLHRVRTGRIQLGLQKTEAVSIIYTHLVRHCCNTHAAGNLIHYTSTYHILTHLPPVVDWTPSRCLTLHSEAPFWSAWAKPEADKKIKCGQIGRLASSKRTYITALHCEQEMLSALIIHSAQQCYLWQTLGLADAILFRLGATRTPCLQRMSVSKNGRHTKELPPRQCLKRHISAFPLLSFAENNYFPLQCRGPDMENSSHQKRLDGHGDSWCVFCSISLSFDYMYMCMRLPWSARSIPLQECLRARRFQASLLLYLCAFLL